MPYVARVIAATDAYPLQRGEVSHGVIQHDPDCAIYTPTRECSCVPDISIHHPGGEVVVVDPEGNVRKLVTS
jgi:hypothetical protein